MHILLNIKIDLHMCITQDVGDPSGHVARTAHSTELKALDAQGKVAVGKQEAEKEPERGSR